MGESTSMAKTPYAWLILFVTCLAHCFWNIAIIQPGGLSQFFFDPSAAHVYTPMEFSMVMTVPFLTTGLFGLVFGVWADKKSLAIATDVGAILGAIGLIARVFCVGGGFLPVFLSSFLMGFGLAGLNANASKIFASWFKAEKVAMLMGLYIGSCTLGAAIALGTGAFFDALQSAFIFSAILGVIVVVLYVAILRDRPKGEEKPQAEPTMEYLKVVASKKLIWLAALSAAIFIAFGTTQNSYLTQALTTITGADLVSAGFVGTIVNVAVICGSLFWPWFATRIGRFRIAAVGALLAAIFTAIAIFMLPFGTYTYVLYFIVGFGAGGGAPIVMAMPALMPGVGAKYAGAGGGLISTVMNLASFLLPSFVLAPLFAGNMVTLFTVIAIGYVIFAVSLFIIPEVGRKGKIWQESHAEDAA